MSPFRSLHRPWAALSLLALALPGCRDVTTPSGERLVDAHVLRGRGAPTITEPERRAGKYVSTDESLAPLQEMLRNLGGTVVIRANGESASTLRGAAAGTVEFFDPRNPTHVSSGSETVTHASVSSLAPAIDIDALSGELSALATHPLLARVLPGSVARGLDLSAVRDMPLDGLSLTVDSEEITTFWDTPRTTFESYERTGETGECENKEDEHDYDGDGDVTDTYVASQCEPGYQCPVDADGRWAAGTCEWTKECVYDEDCRERDFLPAGDCDRSAGLCSTYNEYIEDQSEHDRDAPVLVVRVPLDTDFDPEDGLGGLVDININELVFDLRLQSVPCVGWRCRHRGQRLFEDYRSTAPNDLRSSDAGLDVHVRSTLVSHDISITSGGLCTLPLVDLACIPLLAVAHDTIPSGVEQLGTLPGNILESLIALPTLGVSLPGLGNLDLSRVFAGTGNLPVGASDGAWTDDTIRFLASGGQLNRAEIDLSPIAAVCRSCSDTTSPNCTTCGIICDGEPAMCDLSEFGVCLEFESCEADDLRVNRDFWNALLYEELFPEPTCTGASVTAVPEACPPTGTCDYDGDGLLGLDDPDPRNADADGDGLCDGAIDVPAAGCVAGEDRDGDGSIVVDGTLSLEEQESDPLDPCSPRQPIAMRNWNQQREDLWSMLSTPLEPSPQAAALIDGILALGPMTQSWFTAPLDQLPNEGSYAFTSAYMCGDTDRDRRCEPSDEGAVFRFNPDGDGDEFPDSSDNCPLVANPEQTDTDGDGYGDACDACMWTPDPYNNAHNCNCDIDHDTCINELGLPPIEGAPADVPRECVPAEGAIYDRRPTRVSGNHDNDGDGILSDCDPDSDGDGIEDFEDNCPDDPNPEQEDQNDNGRGDACDLCNAWQPICYYEEVPELFEHLEVEPGSRLLFDCLRDGPGCYDFLVAVCPDTLDGDCIGGRFGLDGVDGGPWLQPESYDAIGVRDVAQLPDLTGDGVGEVVAAMPLSEGTMLAAIDPASGDLLWSHVDYSEDFGRDIVVDSWGQIFVGAPGAEFEQGIGNGAVFSFDVQGNPGLDPMWGEDGEHLGRDLVVRDDQLVAATETGVSLWLDGQRVHDIEETTGNLSTVGDVLVVGQPYADDGGGRVVGLSWSEQAFGEVLFDKGGRDLWPEDSEPGLGMAVSGSFSDRDGVEWVAVGAPGAGQGAGTFVTVSAEGQILPSQIYGYEDAGLGYELSSVGDLDNDELDDLAVGMPFAHVDQEGGGTHALLYGRME